MLACYIFCETLLISYQFIISTTTIISSSTQITTTSYLWFSK